jgi:effector-binding domain-containing protein
MEPQKMAVVHTKGDPNKVLPKIMPALYGSVYTLKFDLKRKGIAFKVGALRGRWPDAHLVPKDQWTGLLGLAVPADTISIPQKVPETEVKLETWDYGSVAQILHKGPYRTEGPTVEKLHKFIAENGYEIAGDHEEEYLTSPKAKAQKTLIRYPIRKKAS